MENKQRLLGGVCTTAIFYTVSYAESSLALWQHSMPALTVEVAP